MTEQLASSLAAWTVMYLVHSTLLLSAAWLLCRERLVRSPALRERVWKGVALAGLVTAALAAFGGWGWRPSWSLAPSQIATHVPAVAATNESPIRLPPASPADRGDPIVIVPAPVETPLARTPFPAALTSSPKVLDPLVDENSPASASPFILQSAKAPDASPSEREAPSPALGSPLAAEPAPSRWAWWSGEYRRWVTTDFGLAVAAWMMLGALRVIWRESRLRRLLRRSRPLTDGLAFQLLRALLKPVSRERGRVRRARAALPQLLVSAEVTEPMACGVWSPCIVLPPACEERLTREELRALLAHELAHLQRGDTIWLWVGRVLCGCLGFQPLNRIARRAWQAAVEIQCDDWAVARHRVPAVALASCLAHVAEWQLPPLPATELAATSTGGPLTYRIERLLGERLPDAWSSRWRIRLSYALTFAAGMAVAAIAPRLDQAVWGRGPEVAGGDLEIRRALWHEIHTDLSWIQAELERLEPAAARHPDAQVRDRFRSLRTSWPGSP